VTVLFLFFIAAVLVAAPMFAQASTQTPVKVQPPASVRARANAPAPPANAKKAASVGKGKATANTANAAGDTDSIWAEDVDIDGDGNVEKTDMLWDDEDKVLYLFADKTFTCTNGGTGAGGVLIAVYGQGNTQKKPAGSGWWAVELDKGECAAQAAGLVGCKFDAQGNATACGAAMVDDKNDDVVIVAASK
jgi:hypothetical protein